MSNRGWTWTTCSCSTGKRCFHNPAQARAAKKSLRNKGEHVRPYVCGECGHIHVGHLPAAVLNGEVSDDDYYGR